MDTLILFIKGALAGLLIAAPVGPVNILCMRRTLAKGRLSGLLSGIGAALADTVFGAIASFGLTAARTALMDHAIWIRITGGLFLVYLGAKTALSGVREGYYTAAGNRVLDISSTFFLTMTNPLTILAFAGIFSAFGAKFNIKDYTSAAVLTSGIFTGSLIWWITIVKVFSHIKEKLSPGRLVWINRISGMLIFTFGMISLLSIIR